MGHMLKIKCLDSMVNVNILASTSSEFLIKYVKNNLKIMLVSKIYLFNGATFIPHRPFDQLSKLTESFALIFSLYYPNV
jgi:hypothetical protein